MTVGQSAGHDQESLRIAAAAGDEDAFRRLTEPHCRAVHLHCYRMLGSLYDADDALQETLLRAWRSLGRLDPHSRLGAWLHAVATNVCLTALARRQREAAPVAAETAWRFGLQHFQPYPDRLLDELEEPAPGPEARYELRETVELAFVTAVQLLPARQRAVLILRDALGWSAAEVAETLGQSVAAVNSALQRARATLDRARPLAARDHSTARERELLQRFMQAWDAVDLDGIVSLLARDALMTMPPAEPAYVSGAEAIREFFATVPAEGRLGEIRLVATAANRQPALACYMRDPADGVFRAYGIMVLSFSADAIDGIVGFADQSLFEPFDLAATLPPDPPTTG